MRRQKRQGLFHLWRNFTVSIPSLVDLEYKPTPRKNRGLLAIFAGITPILALYSLFFAWHVLPRYSNHWKLSSTTITLSLPQYLAVNEEEELRIAIKNEDISSLQVQYILSSSSQFPVFIDYKGTNIFMSGTLQEAEQVNRIVKIFIPYSFSGKDNGEILNGPVDLTLQGSINGGALEEITVVNLSTVPIPWAKTLLGTSFSILTGVFLWFTKEWWDATKKVLDEK